VSDPGKACRVLGWEVGVNFHDLVTMMVTADLERLRVKVGV
jgi:GDP-D-mannose dehydratase